jgi:hypothetical protein
MVMDQIQTLRLWCLRRHNLGVEREGICICLLEAGISWAAGTAKENVAHVAV